MASRLRSISRVLRSTTALCPLVLGLIAPAWVQAATITIDTATTTPLATATVDKSTVPGGVPGDISISGNGSIVPTTAGPILTLNSNNTITNAGALRIDNDIDNSIGISIVAGFTGSVTNSGTLTLGTQNTDPAIIHKNYANNKRGIILNAGGTFTGNLTNSAGIGVLGDNSVGIDLQGTLAGNLSSAGIINVIGDNSAGIRVAAPLNGDLTSGQMQILGINSSGILVLAPISGTLTHNGQMDVTGYEILTQSTATPNNNATQKLQQSGPAIGIGANVGKGVLINGPSAAERALGVILTTESSAGVLGSGNALLISPRLDPTPANILISNVGTGDKAFGVINRGILQTSGIYDGIDAETVRIEGRNIAGTDYLTNIATGLSNDGSITSLAVKANTRSLVIGNLATVPQILTTGTIRSTASGEGNFSSTAVLIESGASSPSLVNKGNILAQYTGPTGTATAIRDASGSLISIANTGLIAARVSPQDDGDPTTVDTATGAAVAIDLSAGGNNVTFTNNLPAGFDPNVNPTAGQILGDVLFGSGADQLNMGSGGVTGNVAFGAGNDQLNITGGQLLGDLAFGAGADVLTVNGATAVVSGSVTDTDGLLSLNIQNGSLGLTETNALNVTAANIGSSGILGFSVEPSTNSATVLNATGSVVFTAGARIAPRFFGDLGGNVNTTIITAPDIQITGDPNDLLSTAVPFFYNLALTETNSGGLDRLNLALTLKSTTELGIAENLAPAFPALLAALGNDQDLSSQFLLASTQAQFDSAFTQMLPSFTDAFLAMEKTVTYATSRQIRDRLHNILTARRGGGAWANEAIYTLDREGDAGERGYDAKGAALSLGFDDLATEQFALGLLFGLDHGSYSENGDFDDPVSLRRWVAGLYGGAQAGKMLYAASVSGARTTQSSQRNVILGTALRSTDAEWHGWKYSADTSASYIGGAGRWSFTPTVGANYVHVGEEGYTEEGGAGPSGGNSIALEVDSRSADSANVYTEIVFGYDLLGRQTIVPFEQGQPYILRPEIKLGYSYDVMDTDVSTRARFLSGTQWFEIQSDQRNQSEATAGVGFVFQTEFGTIGGDVNGVFGDNTTTIVGKLNASFRF